MALGLTLAHAANNMVNDLFDYWQGTDTADYPRANYAPHPILSGLVSTRSLIAAILICNLADLAIAFYLYNLRGLPILYSLCPASDLRLLRGPAAQAQVSRLRRAGDLHDRGPLMIAGTYYALAGATPLSVWVNSIPYGLAVTAVLMGKHLDKAEKDRAKGVRTLPVVLGDQRGRLLTQLMILAFYLAVAVLAGHGDLPWPTLLVDLPGPRPFASFPSSACRPRPRPRKPLRSPKKFIPPDLKENTTRTSRPRLPPVAALVAGLGRLVDPDRGRAVGGRIATCSFDRKYFMMTAQFCLGGCLG